MTRAELIREAQELIERLKVLREFASSSRSSDAQGVLYRFYNHLDRCTRKSMMLAERAIEKNDPEALQKAKEAEFEAFSG